LPNNGRDFNNLLDGVPGVQRSPGGGFQSLNIDGQRATSNNFAVDGIPNNDRYYGESSLGQAAISGTAAALIPLEGISEFNVQSNPGVEFGVKGGSVINIGLKSGTNDIHGSVFWDRHTDAFDARNGFASTVTPFRLNQFGASGGFPIKKDKAFVFMSYQGFHLKDSFPRHVADAGTNRRPDLVRHHGSESEYLRNSRTRWTSLDNMSQRHYPGPRKRPDFRHGGRWHG
jgi:hypothetical protein